MTLLAIALTTSAFAANRSLPTTTTRKQAQDGIQRQMLPEPSAAERSDATIDSTKASRKRAQDAGVPFLTPRSKATEDANKAEDRNREQIRSDAARGDNVPPLR